MVSQQVLRRLEVELLARGQRSRDVAAYTAGVIDTFRRLEERPGVGPEGGRDVSSDEPVRGHEPTTEDAGRLPTLEVVASRAAAALRSVSAYISQPVDPQQTRIDIVSAEKVSRAAANLAFAIQYLDQAAGVPPRED